MKVYFVYILANRKHGTIYIGVTNNLNKRIFEHRQGFGSQFVKKYQIHDLVYYETFEEAHLAIEREKRLKKWHRSWKNELIEALNPEWENLLTAA